MRWFHTADVGQYLTLHYDTNILSLGRTHWNFLFQSGSLDVADILHFPMHLKSNATRAISFIGARSGAFVFCCLTLKPGQNLLEPQFYVRRGAFKIISAFVARLFDRAKFPFRRRP